MKNFLIYMQLLAVSSLLHWFSSGCSGQKGNEVTPDASCRIQRSNSTTHYLSTDSSIQTDYTYDAQGNLTNRTKVSQSTTSTVSSEQTTAVDSYTYDAGGFLSRSVTDVHQQYQFAGKPSEYHYVSTATYTYANERLSTLTRTDVSFQSHFNSGPQQLTVVSSLTYRYDGAGKLQQIIGQGGTGITYQDGKEQTSTMSGDIHVEFQDGLMVKATFPGTDASGASQTLTQVNQYDAQRRLIKHEEYLNDKLDSYFTQEWQSGQPAEASLPTFKGHPVILSASGESGLLLRRRSYSVNKLQQTVQYNEQNFDNQLNTQGYVTNTKLTDQVLTNGAQSPSITTTSYTYTGCP